MNNIAALLEQALIENQLHLDATQCDQLLLYLDCLSRWNRVYNLTAITDPREMVYLHIIDSLLVAPFVEGEKVLDVGTGAGLPGVPLAIYFAQKSPHKHWTLVDKNSKKTRFLTAVIAELGLNSQLTVVHARCEDFYPDQCFDTILARAFTSLLAFAQTNEHLLCAQGQLIAMKGKFPHNELRELSNDWKTVTTPIALTGMTIDRHIVQIKRKGNI